jgi:membrane protease YdiL (CAAX protease family)
MTRAPDIAEIGAVALTAAYNVALNRHLPQMTHLPANLAASGVLLLLARQTGVGRDDLGLAPEAAGPGARTGLMVAAGAAGVVIAGASFQPTRRFFVDEKVRDHTTAELTYHTLLRIPIATALGEELVFRAALLGLFGRGRSRGVAVAATSALFGLWHILPTVESLGPARAAESEPGTTPCPPGTGAGRRARAGRAALVTGVVVATAGAGAAFAALRLRSKSVLAPVVAHAGLNVAALIAARVVSRPETAGPPDRPLSA